MTLPPPSLLFRQFLGRNRPLRCQSQIPTALGSGSLARETTQNTLTPLTSLVIWSANCLVLPACCRNFGAFLDEYFLSCICGGAFMQVVSAVLTGTLLLAGCSQVIDQFYSKKNFNSQAFNADISECKHQNSSFVEMQTLEPKGLLQVNDAMVRECMTTKGYTVHIETK
jgi:hypothetical protein